MLHNKTVQGNVIARDVSFDDYMQFYAADHAEWVEGMVVKLSPVSRKHDLLSQFFILLLRLYLYKTKVGQLMKEPFVMKISPKSSAREPDLHIVLNERANIIQDTMTAGPADVVIEIISPESVDRDTDEKFAEYQAGGVREYWLINSITPEANFYALDSSGIYQKIALQRGVFHSTILPRFSLMVSLLWQSDVLEDDDQIRLLVETMLKES